MGSSSRRMTWWIGGTPFFLAPPIFVFGNKWLFLPNRKWLIFCSVPVFLKELWFSLGARVRFWTCRYGILPADTTWKRDPSLYSYSKDRMHWKTIRQTDLADWCHKQSSSYSSSLKSPVHAQREGKHFYSLWALHRVAHHQPCLSSLLVQCCLFSADGSMPR